MTPAEQESVIAAIRAEAGVRVECLSAEAADKFRADLRQTADPDPSQVDSVVFLGVSKAEPQAPTAWIGFGAGEHLSDEAEASIVEAKTCDQMVETIAASVGVATPGSMAGTGASGSPWWAVSGVVVCTGLLVLAIRWQIQRKRKDEWVDAPRDSRDVDAPQVVAAAKDGETATEASMGVVEGGSSRKGK